MPRIVGSNFLSPSAAGLLDVSAGRRFSVVDLPSSRPKSAIASRMSREPEFRRFLASIGHQADDQDAVTAAICQICAIDSRADLDRDPDAAARFEARIGLPYAAHLQAIKFNRWKESL